jgi:hypothetical protein
MTSDRQRLPVILKKSVTKTRTGENLFWFSEMKLKKNETQTAVNEPMGTVH